MGYEDSKQCQVLATQCAVCARPLVDAVSVETGLGPVCREKSGFNIEVEDAVRHEANQLVYQIAVEQDDSKLLDRCGALVALGFEQLASALMARLVKIKISVLDNGRLSVTTPYSKAIVQRFYKIMGRHWDTGLKATTFPVAQKRPVYDALVAEFAGEVAIGPKGPFVLPCGVG